MTAINNLENKAKIWYDQIAGVIALSEKLGKPVPDLSIYYSQLNNLFFSELDLSRLLDCSDLIIHAEGPSAETNSLKLNAVTNLFEGVGSQIKSLAQSVLKLGMDDVRPAMRHLDIRLNGLAPGSIYAGFSIQQLDSSSLIGTKEEEQLIRSIKQVVIDLAEIPQFINEEGVSDGLSDVFLDPAIRDSSLMAAYKIAPTGRQGIDSIELINPKNLHGNRPGLLNVSDRIVLRRSPTETPIFKSRSKEGTFVGYLRSVDLDKTRVDLKGLNVEGVDSLRCILPELTASKGREILGKKVRVTGSYEASPNGKPRLLHVNKISVMPEDLELDV